MKSQIDNRSFEIMGLFKYLETTFTHQNSIQKEIKSRLKSGNVSCHSGQETGNGQSGANKHET